MTNYNLPSRCLCSGVSKNQEKKRSIYRHVRCVVFVFPHAQILI